MPKVSKKEKQSSLVEAAPMAMDSGEGPSTSQPQQPNFPPLSAYDQNGRRLSSAG